MLAPLRSSLLVLVMYDKQHVCTNPVCNHFTLYEPIVVGLSKQLFREGVFLFHVCLHRPL